MISTPMVPGVAPEAAPSEASLHSVTAETPEEGQASKSDPGCVIETPWTAIVGAFQESTPTAAPGAVTPSP